ncbi:MAG: hypothetical protein JSR46_09985, partial [Verrucomicrobia bacterium]|nr:hypothetical protein [Verrucomicrobiota bacterium]
VDSTGARGATLYSQFPANLELGAFGASIIEQHTGQKAKARRMSRAGDMSFNGIGLPAMFMGVSQVPAGDDETDYVSIAFRKLLGGKMPWWWHTSHDTADKIDPEVLLLDTKIYLSTLWRLCHNPLLPMDFRPVVADILDTLQELERIAGGHVNFSLTIKRALRLAELVENHSLSNDQMKQLSRLLIPITYTIADRFDHDPGWGMAHLPALSDARRLAELDPTSDDYQFLRTHVVRSQNRLNFALRQAIAVL